MISASVITVYFPVRIIIIFGIDVPVNGIRFFEEISSLVPVEKAAASPPFVSVESVTVSLPPPSIHDAVVSPPFVFVSCAAVSPPFAFVGSVTVSLPTVE